MHPLQSADRVILYLDIKSPYAYLAKDPAKELERKFGINIDWRPLTLDIPSFLGSARVNERNEVVEENRSEKQWNSVRYAYYDAKRYARLKDIKIYGPRKIWDTTLIHIGWLFAKKQSRQIMLRYLDDVYERFWMRELDVEDVQVVIESLRRADADIEGFEEYLEGEGLQQHDRLQDELRDAGIFGVPTFVIDSEIFFGRENLPMIHWKLGGSRGAKPDIAYQGF